MPPEAPYAPYAPYETINIFFLPMKTSRLKNKISILDQNFEFSYWS